MFRLPASSGVIDRSHETTRVRSIGLGRSNDGARALDAEAPLSGSTGAVLDPVASIRCSAGATAVDRRRRRLE